eukprot:gene6221-7748_t
MSLVQLRRSALKAVENACRACIDIQKKLITDDTIVKKDQSPVTIGDYTAQALVIDELVNSVGSSDLVYPIIAEEDSSTLNSQPDVKSKVLSFFNSFTSNTSIDGDQLCTLLDKGNNTKNTSTFKRWWTLDPIDGTLGFLRKDQYAVALALMEDNEPIIGVLGCPSLPVSMKDVEGERGCIFIAVKGQGSFMIKLSDSTANEVPISVSDKSDPTKSIFTESYVSRGFGPELNTKISNSMGVTEPPLKIDSQCKYAMVARGDSDIYLRLTQLEYKECIWDHAAGHIIVEEAGGVVRDFKGNKLDYSVGHKLLNNVGIVCSNKNLLEKLRVSIQNSISL